MTAKQITGSTAPDGSRYITLTNGAGILYDLTASEVTVGTSVIAGGTTTKVLYDNAGVLGEYTISGTGNVAMTTSPTFTTPILGTPTSGIATNLTGTASGLTAGNVSGTGVGSLTSLAIGGATIGSNALAVTGNSVFGAGSGTPILSVDGGNGTGVGPLIIVKGAGINIGTMGSQAAWLGSGSSQNFVLAALGSSNLVLGTAGVAGLTITTSTQAITMPGALTVGSIPSPGPIGGTTPAAATFSGNVTFTGAGSFTASTPRIYNDATLGLLIGGGAGATYDLFLTNRSGSNVLAVTANTQTVTLFSSVIMSSLTVASGTPSSICQNTATKEITVNAALTCTVSSLAFKHDFKSLEKSGLDMVVAMKPGSFYYNDNNRLRYGFASEYMHDLDPVLADGYDDLGNPKSIDQNAILAITVKALQELKTINENLEKRIKDLENVS